MLRPTKSRDRRESILCSSRHSPASAFAFLALLLSTIGIFGSVAFFVTARTHEIGVRMALGAPAPSVLRLVIGSGLRPVIAGIGAGSLIAAAAHRSIAGLLYGVDALDPISFALAAAVLLIATTAAALIPAKRAIGVDPLRSLRNH